MDFSVVIPLYNKEPHVAEAIQSALDQSIAAREIIVVDDGSTDGSREIVERLRDPRVKLLTRSPPGPGGYAARNLGIESAMGEWVAFLDADDYWHADHLQSLAEAVAGAGELAGGAFSRLEVVKGSQRALAPVSSRYLDPGKPNSFANMLRAWLNTGTCPIWTSAAAFRRDVLLRAGLFPSGRTLRGGDKDLWLRAMAIAPMAFSQAVTGAFRLDGVNRVSNITRHNELPLITLTIRDLLACSEPQISDLLKQISNNEVCLYAKYSAGRGDPVGLKFLQALYMPSGIVTAIKVLTWSALGLFLGIFRKFQHR
ncbi:MAG: glycosyltransferase family A protein [Sphingomicrobium sp.]